MFTQITSSPGVYHADSFIYKFKPSVYLNLALELLSHPDYFLQIKKLKDDLSAGSDFQGIYGEKINHLYSLLEIHSDNLKLSAKEITGMLHLCLSYKLFFKEMGASLKFNPISERPSARQMLSRIGELLNLKMSLIKPKAVYKECDVRGVNNTLIINGSEISFESKKLTGNFFYNSESISSKENFIIYLVTIGREIDDEVRRLSSAGELLDAYLLNGIGAGAAEMAANDLNLFINDFYGNKYKRYSPGYGDWRLEEQQKLFSLLDSDSINVVLSEGNIMIPEKSTSGIMGY